MATLDPVDNGDSGLEARNKINTNDANLNSDIGQNTNDITALQDNTKNGTTAELISGSRTITFAAPFSDADYTLIINVRDTSGLPSGYVLTAKIAASFTVDLSFDSIVSYIAIKE